MVHGLVRTFLRRLSISRLATAAVLSASLVLAAASIAVATVPSSRAATDAGQRGSHGNAAMFFDNAPSCSQVGTCGPDAHGVTTTFNGYFIDVSCPLGYVVISGGAYVEPNGALRESRAMDARTWRVSATTPDGGVVQPLGPTIICAPADDK